jgi:transposase-like protein
MKRKRVEVERGRWSAKAKREAVLRLLRGEDLDTLSRELRLSAAKLSQWRDAFLASGEAGLKVRETEGNGCAERLICGCHTHSFTVS